MILSATVNNRSATNPARSICQRVTQTDFVPFLNLTTQFLYPTAPQPVHTYFTSQQHNVQSVKENRWVIKRDKFAYISAQYNNQMHSLSQSVSHPPTSCINFLQCCGVQNACSCIGTDINKVREETFMGSVVRFAVSFCFHLLLIDRPPCQWVGGSIHYTMVSSHSLIIPIDI